MKIELTREQKDLRNREARLRRNAANKGLFIRKRKWREYYDQYFYESHIGYCIGVYEHGFIVHGGTSYGTDLPTLEEAESLVAEY